MSKSLTKTYTTTLETVDKSEIIQVLNDKLNVISPQGLVDYVAFAIENLDDKLERIAVIEDELKLRKAEAKAQKEYIKLEVANFFESNGITKIEGDRISSITTYNPKPTEELHYADENALIDMGYMKLTLDKTAVKQAIKDGLIDKELAYLSTTPKPTTIKINKKRGA